MSARVNRWRNDLAWLICNFALNVIATKEYSRKISGLIQQGMFAARTDPFAQWQFIDYKKDDPQ